MAFKRNVGKTSGVCRTCGVMPHPDQSMVVHVNNHHDVLTCDHCGEQVVGALKMDEHVDGHYRRRGTQE